MGGRAAMTESVGSKPSVMTAVSGCFRRILRGRPPVSLFSDTLGSPGMGTGGVYRAARTDGREDSPGLPAAIAFALGAGTASDVGWTRAAPFRASGSRHATLPRALAHDRHRPVGRGQHRARNHR